MSVNESTQNVVLKGPRASRSSPAPMLIVALVVLGIAFSMVFAHFDMHVYSCATGASQSRGFAEFGDVVSNSS
jgi:hypothetical protein